MLLQYLFQLCAQLTNNLLFYQLPNTCSVIVQSSLSQPGECPVVLEVTQEEDSDDRDNTAAILPVQGISVDSAHSTESFNAGPVCFS